MADRVPLKLSGLTVGYAVLEGEDRDGLQMRAVVTDKDVARSMWAGHFPEVSLVRALSELTDDLDPERVDTEAELRQRRLEHRIRLNRRRYWAIWHARSYRGVPRRPGRRLPSRVAWRVRPRIPGVNATLRGIVP